MKFGMFICWSYSTFYGEEWTPALDKDAAFFKATACDTDQWCKVAKDAEANYKGYLAAEFTYPILPPHEGGAMWIYSLPKHDGLCHPAEKLYQDYRGAVEH